MKAAEGVVSSGTSMTGNNSDPSPSRKNAPSASSGQRERGSIPGIFVSQEKDNPGPQEKVGGNIERSLCVMESSSSIAGEEISKVQHTPIEVQPLQISKEWNLELIPEEEDPNMKIQMTGKNNNEMKWDQIPTIQRRLWRRNTAKRGRVSRQEQIPSKPGIAIGDKRGRDSPSSMMIEYQKDQDSVLWNLRGLKGAVVMLGFTGGGFASV
ncbi:pentatricopeptide repeat (PPR) superfamily protein [Striga asiatica]|uniref:Pentatricopeptide repeat (PPR) superfamily protein n=1 Tax=Striga asiatica TaxID=4170 RepID=A0A5A7RBS0_STRAF|nr:pentatricopeptide repeat (PPR) superfamily protein [Striga asiatica]